MMNTLSTLLTNLATEVTNDLDADVEIVELAVLDPTKLAAAVPKWHATDDVVAVFADLKNSTRLNLRQHPKSSAKTYEAATGGAVQAMSAFEPEFIDVQGDGVYALFSGERRYERALCAAVTVRTWSERTLVPKLKAKFGERFPDTGFKVGMAASRLLGKRVGVRGTNEPVWAGRAVNFAAKLAQEVDAHEILVTDKVFAHFEDNEYVMLSCGCSGTTPGSTPAGLWTECTSSKLPDGNNTVYRLGCSGWCATHGEQFCDAILAGLKKRGLVGRVA